MQHLDGSDEILRAKAARRLQELRHPRALDACLRTLDDAPDMLHDDYTPSVGALIAIGRPALGPLVERLEAPALLTRRRALNAIRAITRMLFGFDGRRWPDGTELRWRRWWESIGYDPAGEDAARGQAVAKLRAWPGP